MRKAKLFWCTAVVAMLAVTMVQNYASAQEQDRARVTGIGGVFFLKTWPHGMRSTWDCASRILAGRFFSGMRTEHRTTVSPCGVLRIRTANGSAPAGQLS